MKTGVAIISILWVFISSSACVSGRRYASARVAADSTNQVLAANIKKLEDSVSALHERVSDQEVIEYQLYKTSSELSITREYVATQKMRMMQLQASVKQQRFANEDLKMKLLTALVGFNARELSVMLKNGRVYVILQDALLFPSGSDKVTPRGREALAKLAQILNANLDIRIDVEGHTDNVPISTAQFADNWALSTARATAVARILTTDYEVSPLKLIASGRSSHDPISSNATPEGRAQNRRTEIILEPRYEELMQIMNPTVYK